MTTAAASPPATAATVLRAGASTKTSKTLSSEIFVFAGTRWHHNLHATPQMRRTPVASRRRFGRCGFVRSADWRRSISRQPLGEPSGQPFLTPSAA
jgi:hypothetical protein